MIADCCFQNENADSGNSSKQFSLSRHKMLCNPGFFCTRPIMPMILGRSILARLWGSSLFQVLQSFHKFPFAALTSLGDIVGPIIGWLCHATPAENLLSCRTKAQESNRFTTTQKLDAQYWYGISDLCVIFVLRAVNTTTAGKKKSTGLLST